MQPKLIFLDIDGTLTPPGSNTPPDSALAAIWRAQANGHKIYLCTGRNAGMLSPLLGYGFDGAVTSAGGYVFSGQTVLFDCPMTPEEQKTALDNLHAQGVYCTIEARDAAYADEGLKACIASVEGQGSEFLRWRAALETDLDIRPMSAYDGRPIYKIDYMFQHPEQLKPAKEALEKQFHFVDQGLESGRLMNGEMINRRFDKGQGVRQIAAHLGMGIEHTIGFGDSMNDVEMLETVGTAVCMEKGAPLLRQKSDLICPDVLKDGLAWAFQRLGLCDA